MYTHPPTSNLDFSAGINTLKELLIQALIILKRNLLIILISIIFFHKEISFKIVKFNR